MLWRNPVIHLMVSGCLVSVITGCSASYNGERLLWKAQQLSTTIAKDPTQATPEQVAKVVHAFQRVIKKTPGTVWAARAQSQIGSWYLAQKRYDQAREAYGQVLQEYSRYTEESLAARYAIAKSYEFENRWEDAIRQYHELIDHHPWSRMGLEAPIYIGLLYERHQQLEQANEAFERAASLYAKLIPEAPTAEAGVQVKSYLALTYERLGQWEKAAHLLADLSTLASGVNRPMLLMTLGTIYQTRLHDEAKAHEVYTKFLQEFPEHPLGKVVKEQLAHHPGTTSATESLSAGPSTTQ